MPLTQTEKNTHNNVRCKDEVTHRRSKHIVEVDHSLNVVPSVQCHDDGRKEKEVAQRQKQHLYQLTGVGESLTSICAPVAPPA